MTPKPDVFVFGAGPAGLMAAEVLAAQGLRVEIHDRMASPARKFLLAGRGGLNLTHSEPIDILLSRYGPARDGLEAAIRAFPPQAVISWCEGLGIETFIGSSGRVFPRCMKASPLLRAWLKRLDGLGVKLVTQSSWKGFDQTPAVLALGGASWPRLGSDAGWVTAFNEAGITVSPFRPSNCRFIVPWTEHFASRFAGIPIKNVRLQYRNESARGEIMISRDGIEGGAIYQLSRIMREEPGERLLIDLRPELSEVQVEERMQRRKRGDSTSNFLRKAFGLPPVAISLMRETGAESVKSIAIPVQGPAGLERAISSAGGILFNEIGADYQLKKRPGVFVAGEMLDWEAPTGGYLLQACFSTGVAAAHGVLNSLRSASAPTTPHSHASVTP